MAKARKKSAKLSDLAGQPDPKAPLDSAAFLKASQPVLEMLTKDLLVRADGSAGITRALKARHAFEVEKKLTADKYEIWRRNIVVQIAAAWLLSCVFVRTLEDRGLLPNNRIAGPGATDAQHLFFSIAPYLTERDYLRTIFTELEHVPACKELFDREHNLAWRLAPSAEATKELLGLFRTPDPAVPAFRFGQSSTRFLGDLYQDLSEEVRKRFALLQTPDFIEEFILDRTLEPAVEEFGLADTTVIDPTCGSGHFLLGAFERLFEKWCAAEPGGSVEAAVEKALGSVCGVDVNPYAVSIARFRLTLRALEKLRLDNLFTALTLPLNLAVADSLLHNFAGAQKDFGDLTEQSSAAWKGEQFALEDEVSAKLVLGRTYAAVVGNPPYITVKDEVLRERYRSAYRRSAIGKYSLSAPFMEKFFQLARDGGFIGQITSNAFTKREFGRGLVEKVLAGEDVTLVVNTAGTYIPGHGTPTVLVFARHRAPTEAKIRVVLARRSEPTTPDDPSQGLVWTSIRDHWGESGFQNEFITVEEFERAKLAHHPWSLEGGGAGELKLILEERCEQTLHDIAEAIGFASFTGLDDIFILPRGVPQRHGIPDRLVRGMVVGEDIRDWAARPVDVAICPYDDQAQVPLPLNTDANFERFLWPFRTAASNVASFAGRTRAEEGQNWWTWYRWQSERYLAPLRISFAFVATHNHFALDRGGVVFKQSAPVITLRRSASETQHLALLAYLNSSTACFWMKQVAFNKSNHTEDRPETFRPETIRFEFASTAISGLPIPQETERLATFSRGAEALVEAQSRNSPVAFASAALDRPEASRELLSEYETRDREFEQRLVGLQEQLDWYVYGLLGLAMTSEAADALEPGSLSLTANTRPFECSSSEAPPDLTDAYRRIWLTWVEESRSSSHLRLLESRENKRRWVGANRGSFAQSARTYRERCIDALSELLLDRVERVLAKRDTVATRNELLSAVRDTPAMADLVGWVFSDPDALHAQVCASSVPFLSPFRFTETGLEKSSAWQRTWQLQRLQDAGEFTGAIPTPPKYDQKDYEELVYFRLRGKLDVPKERFISYPGCGSDLDNEPIYGWAGWDHAQRAKALAAVYVARKEEEQWSTDRLRPLLAGLAELLPWLIQWHNQPNPEFGQGLGGFFAEWLAEECRTSGLVIDDLQKWRPNTSRVKETRSGQADPRLRRDVAAQSEGSDA